METPNCVIDAKTLVANVHLIKKWMYEGRLRLIIPTETFEGIQRFHEKSTEPKKSTQDQSRPKSAGKMAKREHPTFDINPRIALEYLSRIQKGKEGESSFKDRPLYQEEEAQKFLEFQAPLEEYTPWKDMPMEREKEEVPDDHPITWADAARKKQNSINGNGDKAHGSRGPVKPKLVSKTPSSDASPWKIQRNAPKMPPNEVPPALRPLMSYILWRNHESVHRNDPNQSFLLADETKVRDIAGKLNVLARSMKDMKEYIEKREEKTDRNIIGNLERDGLVASVRNKESDVTISQDVLVSKTPRTEQPVEKEDSELTSIARPTQESTSSQLDGAAKSVEVGKVAKIIAPIEEIDRVTRKEQTDKTEPLEGPGHQPSENNAKPAQELIDPQELVRDLLDPSESIPSYGVFRKTPESTPEITSHTMVSHLSNQQVAPMKDSALQDKIGSSMPTEQQLLHKAIVQDSLEDSDEEVVVFVPNPKRMSAQKKSGQPSSRPTTSNGAMQTNEAAEVKEVRNSKDDLNSLSNLDRVGSSELKPASQPRKPIKKISEAASRPDSSGPTVIDPDAFGRGFAMNPSASPRSSSGRPYSRHSPQPSTVSTHTSSVLNGAAASFQPRTSPRRQETNRSPRRIPQVDLTTSDDNESSQSNVLPLISHQVHARAPLIAPSTQSSKQSQFGPIAPPSKSAKGSSAATLQDPDFDRTLPPPPTQQDRTSPTPKTSNDSGYQRSSHKPRRSSPRATPLNGSGSLATLQQKQRAPKPSLFEPALDDTRAPTPPPIVQNQSRMGDVQYVLKSGMTREASRGKGKLWTG